MRTSGIIPYITPRQIATESSTTPKSVMKTMVGGYFCVPSLAARTCGDTTNGKVSARTKRTPARNPIAFRKDKENIIRSFPILCCCPLDSRLNESTHLGAHLDAASTVEFRANK